MKTLTTFILTLLFFTAQISFAQMHHGEEKSEIKNETMMQSGMMDGNGMMQPGMMGRGMMMHRNMGGSMCPMCGMMMNQKMPMKKYMMLVNHLPGMQQQLSLTEGQSEKLIDLRAEFKKQQADLQAELEKKQMKMDNMLKNDPSVDEIRSHMKSCADKKIEIKVAAYETAGKMKAVLTDEQKEELKNTMMQSGMMQGMNNQ